MNNNNEYCTFFDVFSVLLLLYRSDNVIDNNEIIILKERLQQRDEEISMCLLNNYPSPTHSVWEEYCSRRVS